MILGGYTGEYLRIDLSSKKVTRCLLSEEQIRPFIGCSGYAVKMLWDELEAKVDPLSPGNKVIFSTGPVAGTLCPSGGSYELCFKSPLTGAWCQSRSGGGFGPKLKYAGYDFIVIEGKAENPVYIWIHDKEAEIRDASHLWGKGVECVTEKIHREIDDLDASVAIIGQAGENLVKFAAVINDRGRAAGRGGGGAVLGSKNLKAIAVNGTLDIKVADPEAFKAVMIETEENLSRYPFEAINQFGTPLLMNIQNAAGALPTKNFTMGTFHGVDKLGGEVVTEKNLIKRRACYGCSMGCGRYTMINEGKWKIPPMEGPEYETLAALGSLNLNDDLDSIIYANYLCNDFGLDTISTGMVISFAIECYEKGVLTREDTEGLELKWGDSEQIVSLIEKVALRKGLGDILADGVRSAAIKIGKNAQDFALEVKGMELPLHEPRGEAKIMALQYAVNPRGACHMHPNWGAIWDSGNFECGMNALGQPWPPTDKYLEGGNLKGLAYRYVSIQGEISEIVGACVFHSWGADDACITPALYAKILRALVGWDIDQFELFNAADRSWVLKRCFNIREGLTRKDDTIPARLKEPLPTGVSKGQAVTDIDIMIDEYYDAVGWDKETGIPYRETLEDLGLTEVIQVFGNRLKSKNPIA